MAQSKAEAVEGLHVKVAGGAELTLGEKKHERAWMLLYSRAAGWGDALEEALLGRNDGDLN